MRATRCKRRKSSAPPATDPPLPRVGVFTASSAPTPSASYTKLAFPVTVAVTTRMGHGDACMIARVASTPLTRGMMRSIRITSGRSPAAFVIASSPSRAIHAIESAGSLTTTRRNASHATARSLTMATLMRWLQNPCSHGFASRARFHRRQHQLPKDRFPKCHAPCRRTCCLGMRPS